MMLNKTDINKQALREAAEKADFGEWSYEEFSRLDLPGGARIKINGRGAVYCLNKATGGIKQSRAVLAYIAAFNPKVALALMDELEADKEQIKTLESRNCRLEGIIDAAEKRIAEQSKAASVDSQWKPDVCPITGRRFFMWIEHPSLGYVPTYGGPFDSYTIPTRDSSGEFSRERYDHDLGGWREGECVGLYLIDDDERCRVYELEQRIAELEARTVNLSKLSVGEVMHMSGFSRDYAEGWCAGNGNAIHEIRAAGIKVKG